MARFADAYNAEDWDAVRSLCSDDVESWTFLQGRSDAEPLRGMEGITVRRDGERDVLDSRRLESTQIEEVDEGLVVVTATVSLAAVRPM